MRWLRLLLFSLPLLPAPALAVQGVVATVHNLSISGPGTVKSETVSQVCVFCHTPHSANPGVPLWNRKISGTTYSEYQSSTLKTSAGQPTGRSRLCLSCHDGTVALGALRNPPPGREVDLVNTFLTGRASLGTDLSDDHPISFRYDGALKDANQELVHPGQIDLPLERGEMQCTTCHEPHEKDIVPFLRKTTLNGELCIACHRLGGPRYGWDFSSHATSPARPKGLADPWSERKPEWRGTTVAENACFNCHAPHGAITPERLVKEREEETCFLCHDGNVAATDIRSEIRKPSRHPVDLFANAHDPTETFGGRRAGDHVECSDCHNPHGVESLRAKAPFVPGALSGVSGIMASGAPVAEATRLDEVCYKCHADYNAVSSPTITRQIFELNTRLEFDLGNPSYHPVQGIGRSSNVPSLIHPMTETSLIYCTDCHNNDSGPGNGGSGASGPHGSIFRPLLERNYSTADNTPESSFAYALCYKCHYRTQILSDVSFAEHRLHIVDENTPCSGCHDPHGINAIQGNPVNNSHLINFDLTIVFPNSVGEGPVFEDLGLLSGQCSLSCHGKDHQSLRY